MDVFEEENLLQQAEALGQKVRKRFDQFKEQFEIVGDVRGLGPMLAMELVKDRETKEPADEKAKDLEYELFIQLRRHFLHAGKLY